IPNKKTEDCYIYGDNQLDVLIQVFEGAKFQVTFDVDANSTLNVSVLEKSTGKANKITITNYNGHLSKEDIEHMVNDIKKAVFPGKKTLNSWSMMPKITRPKKEEAVSHTQAKNGFKSYAYNLQNEKVENDLSEEDKTKLNAVNSLESYACSLRNTLQDEKIGDVLPE
ncbi:Hsp70 chaperone, partial [Rhizopus stolonifer]